MFCSSLQTDAYLNPHTHMNTLSSLHTRSFSLPQFLRRLTILAPSPSVTKVNRHCCSTNFDFFFSEKIPRLGWMRNPTNTDSGCTFVSCLLTRPLGDIRPVEPLRPETASSRRRCQSNEAPPSLTPRAGWAVTRVFE